MKVLILLCALVALIFAQQKPPVWPGQFTVKFNETATLIGSGHTDGIFYYVRVTTNMGAPMSLGFMNRTIVA